jgi:hypothetical protein
VVERLAGAPGPGSPPGWASGAQGPPGYAQGPADRESDPFDEVAPPGWKGKESFVPGYKDAGPPADEYYGAPGSSDAAEPQLNRLPEGPPGKLTRTRPRDGVPGPPSPGSGPARPPGSNSMSDYGPPGTTAQQRGQPGAPGPSSRSGASQMAARYFREPQRPLGIREPDTNLTIDQIITNVLGGPEGKPILEPALSSHDESIVWS